MGKNNVSEISNPRSLRTLMIDDSEDDVLLIIRTLKKGGFNPLYERIETAAMMKKAIKEKQWDIILCDYKMPKFNAPSAIALLKEANINIPLIIISGTIGEETAIECMRLGAHDYIMKTNLSRLCPAIARELDEVKIRDRKNLAESQREAALELLHQSEEKYRTILENMQESYFEVDFAGNFTFVNDALCRNIGYSKDELLKVNYQHYSDKEDSKKVFQAYNKVYKTGEPLKELSWQIIRKDGAKRYIAGSISLKKDASGRKIGFTGIARDITERIQIEDKLRDEEQRFRVLTEQSADIILLINRKGIITYENRVVGDILGYDRQARIGASSLENIHPDDLNHNMDEFKKLFKDINAPVLQTEIRLRHKDGSWRVFEEMASGLSRDNVVESVIVNLRDITERKKMEEKLRDEEQLFRALAEQSSDIIILVNREGIITYANPTIDILGINAEKRIGGNVFERVHPDDLKIITDSFKILFSDPNAPVQKAEMRIRHADGNWLTLEAMGSSLVRNNVVEAAIVNLRDITERKRAEEALRGSEAKYRNIFENAMEGIYQATNEGKFITVNDAFARMAGYDSPAELMDDIKDIGNQLYVHPEDRKRFLQIRKTKGFVNNFEVEFYKKDRSIFWVVINARAVMDEKGKILYTEGLIEDITLRKQAEDKLHQSLERLKKAVNTTIQVLVSALEVRDPYTVGHQLRSANLASAIAAEMGLRQEIVERIGMAGSIHDIGKISIPTELLSKPTKLTNIEFSLIKEHPFKGYEMLKDVEPSWPLAEIVYQHHERIDGSGYPRNLKGDEILVESRILAVADVVEAIASHRPYRPAFGVEVALEEIEKNKGVLYDDVVVNACIRLFREKGYVFV